MSLVKATFGLQLKVLHVLGLYSYKNSGIAYKILGFFYQFLLVHMYNVLGCSYLVFGNIGLVQVADNAFVLGEMVCYITKYGAFIWNADKFQKCLDYLENPVFMPKNAKQQAFLNEFQESSRRNYKMFMCLVFGGVSGWSVRPLLFDKIDLPIDIWFPVDYSKDWRIFWALYAYLVLAVAYGAACSLILDPLVASLASFAVAQLRILKDNLRNLSVYVKEDLTEIMPQNKTDRTKNEIIYKRIMESVIHHNEIIRFLNLYEEIFSMVVFSQFMGSVFVICVSLFQLTLVEPLTFDFFAMIDYIITMLLEIFFYCYYGTLLYNESDSISEAIYMSDWYKYDVKSRKALVILMSSTSRPKYVKALNVLDLSLETFSTIIRRSYSLLAVLNTYEK